MSVLHYLQLDALLDALILLCQIVLIKPRASKQVQCQVLVVFLRMSIWPATSCIFTLLFEWQCALDECVHTTFNACVICDFRWQVLKFVLAASIATRALFARLQQRSIILKSISLLDCLLEAHAAIVTTSESLGASLGNAAGPETQQVLQVSLHQQPQPDHSHSL